MNRFADEQIISKREKRNMQTQDRQNAKTSSQTDIMFRCQQMSCTDVADVNSCHVQMPTNVI